MRRELSTSPETQFIPRPVMSKKLVGRRKTPTSSLLCNSMRMIRRVIRITRGRPTAPRILEVVSQTPQFWRQKRSNCNRIKTPTAPIVGVYAPHMIRRQMSSKLGCSNTLFTVKKIILPPSIRNKKLSLRPRASYKTKGQVQIIISRQTASSPCQ